MEILHRWLSCFDCTLHSPRNGWHTIVDFSRYVSSSAAIAIALITMDELFPTNDITMAVRVPSRFSASGIGFRKLSGTELCLVWDFPLWIIPESQRITASFIDGIRPLKADLVLSGLVFATLYCQGDSWGSSPIADLVVPIMDPRGIKLKQLDVWLTPRPRWIDSDLITGKVVKIDTVSVPVQLWNRCIAYSLGVPTSSLPTFFHGKASWKSIWILDDFASSRGIMGCGRFCSFSSDYSNFMIRTLMECFIISMREQLSSQHSKQDYRQTTEAVSE